MKIDHIAIAVNDVEAAAKEYQQALGVDKIEFETVATEGVRVAIMLVQLKNFLKREEKACIIWR
jgi:catechol-2,3-dioxygenase